MKEHIQVLMKESEQARQDVEDRQRLIEAGGTEERVLEYQRQIEELRKQTGELRQEATNAREAFNKL